MMVYFSFFQFPTLSFYLQHVYDIAHQSLGRQNHLQTINASLLKDESAWEHERFITHQRVLGKFRNLILSFQAVDAASDSTLLN